MNLKKTKKFKENRPKNYHVHDTGEYVGECHVGPPHVRDDVFDDQEIRHDCCLNSFEGQNKGRG